MQHQATAAEIDKAAKRAGMHSLADDGLAKACARG